MKTIVRKINAVCTEHSVPVDYNQVSNYLQYPVRTGRAPTYLEYVTYDTKHITASGKVYWTGQIILPF